jgi:GrpB-like predicted nucleotidyltransferase (UPF0157 family)
MRQGISRIWRPPDTCCSFESLTGTSIGSCEITIREVQVHVFTAGSLEVERMLLFRDRLRARPEERELYERTKRELAARRWDYIEDYADAKSSVVEEIISRAHADQKHER